MEVAAGADPRTSPHTVVAVDHAIRGAVTPINPAWDVELQLLQGDWLNLGVHDGLWTMGK